jgi:hypothetical protein
MSDGYGLAIVAVFCAIIGFMIGVGLIGSSYQERAISAKVAKWVINEETGEKTFIFITPDNVKTEKDN